MRLPLWVRVFGGVALWAVAYHYWLPFVTWLTEDVLQLGDSAFASALEFFIYDTVKVLLLLAIVVFGVGIVRSFFSPERTRALLRGRREATGNVMAASLGIVTPFCSCSAVPLFIGFVEAGIPLGVTLSFLIAAPMVNEIALVLLYGLFGWKVATLYLVTGLLIAMVAGWVIGRLKMERYIQDWVLEVRMGEAAEGERLDWPARVGYAWQAVKEIVGKVWLYVVIGIAVGAVIHGYVPEDFMAGIMGEGAWWSVPARGARRDPHVLERRRHHPDRRGVAREGRRPGHGAGLHDGRHRSLAARDDHPQARPQMAAYRGLPRRGRRRHHVRRLPVQLGAVVRTEARGSGTEVALMAPPRSRAEDDRALRERQQT